jgi:hypothetical protein
VLDLRVTEAGGRMNNGRKFDVLIEDQEIYNPDTGEMQKVPDEFICWADAGLNEVIMSVDGVSHVHSPERGRYFVGVDHRYDIDFVKREVEAAILCGGDEK